MRNANNPAIDAIASTEITQPNDFAPVTPIYMSASGKWEKARSNALETLATHLVKAVTGVGFTLARDGDIIAGIVDGSPGQLVHCSGQEAGALAIASGGSESAPGAIASNVVGYMVNSTDFIVKFETPFRQ